MVQLDYDEDTGPLHGMYGSMEAECEVQRTIKRAKVTAFFLCLLKKVCGPIKVPATGLTSAKYSGETLGNLLELSPTSARPASAAANAGVTFDSCDFLCKDLLPCAKRCSRHRSCAAM